MQLGLFSDSFWSLVTGHRRPQAAAAVSHPADPPSLYDRLRAAGLPAVPRFETHRNQQVMLSWLPGRRLRIHEGYAAAPDEVLRAIVKFLTPGVRRASRVAARQVFLSFPVERHAPPRSRRPPRPRPGDQELLLRLTTLQAELNLTHFNGQLTTLPIRLSSRMRRRLGELRLERKTGRAVHIGLSRRHALHDPWPEVRDTLLHELVHQWQAETGRPVDHGREFRRMAREVGIVPRAVRTD
ncbi:MAG: SprT-like domain-containing protein [Gemmatimonadota bacterium]|nr:SprT-like domain-containing protein [Gemmatimonadota bacterium]